MKMTWRAFLTVATLATVVPLSAQAQWRDQGGRGGYGQRGYPQEGARSYGGDRGSRGGYGGPGFGALVYNGGGYGGGGWRRGQVLPPERRGAYVPDPGRYHLRAAPPGYGWVGDGRNAYLTQRSTGMVLDSVPGAYEPAPVYRGRRRR